MKLVQKKKFKPKLKPMFKNLQNELYQLQNKQAKGVKPCPTLGRSCRANKTAKRFPQYLKDKICKFKQYLNNILMIINQNIKSAKKL